MFRRCAAFCGVICVVVLWVCSSAVARTQGWQVVGSFAPTNLAPGGSGVLDLYVYAPGARSVFGQFLVSDTLPEGVTATGGRAARGKGRHLRTGIHGTGKADADQYPGHG